MKKTLLLLLLFLIHVTCLGQDQNFEYYKRTQNGVYNAIKNPDINRKVFRVWERLVQYTGKRYPVYPAQNYNLGQALPGGIILLDLSIAGETESILAFWLAHEYAHQVLGHTNLMLQRNSNLLFALAGTKFEDEADIWAANFIKKYKYDVGFVLNFFCDLPNDPNDRSHSKSLDRASAVAKIFNIHNYDCNTEVESDELHEIRFRMWAQSEGNICTFKLDIDDDYVGIFSNKTYGLLSKKIDLKMGVHNYKIYDLVAYDAFGNIMIRDFECEGEFTVSDNSIKKIRAFFDGYQRYCAIE